MVMGFVRPAGGPLVVSRPADQTGALLARDPNDVHASMAQVVVEGDDVAVVLRDGKVLGVLPPGRHTLDAAILPFLQAVSDAGRFRANIAFVRLAPLSGCGFGGPVGTMRDRAGGFADMTLFGTCTFRVADPVRFVNDMVGAAGTEEDVSRWVKEKLMGLCKSCLIEWMAGGYFDVSTVANAGPQLAQAVAAHSGELAEYGLELVRIDSMKVVPR